MNLRLLAGFTLATAIALLARRTRSLSNGGALAAVAVGTIAVAAGWSWGALLIVYFASSTLLSHFGRAEKERRTSSMVAKGGERDATQVLANGLFFALGALATLVDRRAAVRWLAMAMAMAAGSLAASAADTWATEIGTLYGKRPRSILTGRVVAAGTSGGVSLIGTLASIAGACFVGVLARAVGWDEHIARVAVLGGVAGSLVDSLLGATLQSRRWCDACAAETERRTHDCGAETRRLRGVGWLDNDAVNLASNFAGGLLAAILSR